MNCSRCLSGTASSLRHTAMSAGSETCANPASSSYLSVAALDETAAVLCYRDEAASQHGRCSLLTRSDAPSGAAKHDVSRAVRANAEKRGTLVIARLPAWRRTAS